MGWAGNNELERFWPDVSPMSQTVMGFVYELVKVIANCVRPPGRHLLATPLFQRVSF